MPDELGRWEEFQTDRFEVPDAPLGALQFEPRLASWDAAGSAGQLRLAEWLDHAETLASPVMQAHSGPLGLRLDVRTPDGIDPRDGRDLDNYLTPLMQRLGANRFSVAVAAKGPGLTSCLHIAPAKKISADDQLAFAYAIRVSAETPRYKESVSRSVLTDWTGAQPDPKHVAFEADVPLDLTVALGVGANRNWANLFKATIDGLGPIFGIPDPARRWNVGDGRVVRLALHRTLRPELGHTVMVEVEARVPDRADPLISWWRPEARVAALSPLWAASSPIDVELRPNEIIFEPVTGLVGFRAAIEADRPLIIASGSGRRLHPHPATCPGVQERHYERSLQRDVDRARYLLVADSELARKVVARLPRCGHCGDRRGATG